MDPGNVMQWAGNIAEALAAQDPANADDYMARAAAYQAELAALDEWIVAQVNTIPEGQRQLVTDHDALGYFAARYGFEVVGAVIPGTSTVSEASAAEIAELEAAIADLGVAAIFVGTTVSDDLAARVAADTGVELVALYTGALSGPDGPAGSYLEMMRFNVAAIVAALGGE